jgi:putative ABC transport system permease protein
LLANIIAWPFAWWLMRSWLDGFSYRTDIDISIFVLSAIAAILVAIFTVLRSVFTAATVNPTVTLRSG